MLGAREDIDLLSPNNVCETREREDLAPFCFVQCAGDSAGPEVDVVARVLGHFQMHDDVRDLNAPSRL